MRRTWAVLAAIAFVPLSGCVDVAFDVKASNKNATPLTVHVWINDTASGDSQHFEGRLQNLTQETLGHFASSKGDYSVHVRAGPVPDGSYLTYRETRHYVGPASAPLQVEIGAHEITVFQGERKQF